MSLKLTINNLPIQTTYLDGFQYVSGSLRHFPHSEGYVNVYPDGTTNLYNYVFNYTDHLGNIRLRYAKDPLTHSLKILEQDHYYPFGLKHKNYSVSNNAFEKEEVLKIKQSTAAKSNIYDYKYNGKELQDELGLNLYDFHFRQYMQNLGRTTTLDPLAEKFYSISPYSFLNNSPLYFVDPTGMASEEWLKVGNNYIWDDRVTDQATATEYHGENAAYVGVNKTVSTVRNGEAVDAVTLNDNGTVTKGGTTLQVNDRKVFTNEYDYGAFERMPRFYLVLFVV